VVLLNGTVSTPESVVMRGRIEAYEIVIDSACIEPGDVAVIDR
jgi:hypothetical protein